MRTADSTSTFSAFAAAHLPRIEEALEGALPPVDVAPESLHQAMRHPMFPGGKRLRPMLAVLGARVTGGDLRRVWRPAAALELLHTYSLVHDDLPCMDDDDLRRGRPTCHVVFGDATAVLAGDALLTLAFELVAEAGTEAVVELARAAGSLGMVGGQAADLAAEGAAPLSLERVQGIHDRKTGALIRASLLVGAHAGGAEVSESSLAALGRYGALVGRAFQVADDCLDLTATAEILGKNPGQDLAAHKLTYPAVLGLEESQALALRLSAEASEQIPEILAPGDGADTMSPQGSAPDLDADAQLLHDVASYSVTRSH